MPRESHAQSMAGWRGEGLGAKQNHGQLDSASRWPAPRWRAESTWRKPVRRFGASGSTHPRAAARPRRAAVAGTMNSRAALLPPCPCYSSSWAPSEVQATATVAVQEGHYLCQLRDSRWVAPAEPDRRSPPRLHMPATCLPQCPPPPRACRPGKRLELGRPTTTRCCCRAVTATSTRQKAHPGQNQHAGPRKANQRSRGVSAGCGSPRCRCCFAAIRKRDCEGKSRPRL